MTVPIYIALQIRAFQCWLRGQSQSHLDWLNEHPILFHKMVTAISALAEGVSIRATERLAIFTLGLLGFGAARRRKKLTA